MVYRIPLVYTPQPEGGFTVTSPVLPELLTEGDTLDEAQANVRDAFDAVVELYEEEGHASRRVFAFPIRVKSFGLTFSLAANEVSRGC